MDIMYPVDGATSSRVIEGIKRPLKKSHTTKISSVSKESLKPHLLQISRPLPPLQIPKTMHSIGSLWSLLQNMHETYSKEQLHDLLLLCDLKKDSAPFRTSQSLISFAFYIAQEPSISISKSRNITAKLSYLVNQDLNKITTNLETLDEFEKTAYIESAFDTELRIIAARINKFILKHEKAMVQPKDKAKSVRIPIEIAKALVNDTGYINIGIIDSLIKALLSKTKKMPFEQNIIVTLNNITRSSRLRQKLHLITAPFCQTLPINDLIRITLGLDSKAITTPVDAKKTALAALISHMRQSPAGSCFATFLAIELLSKQLSSCLDDFCELLHNNNISRVVHDQPQEFSFLMRTGKASTSKLITLDKNGKIYSDNGKSCYTWKIPGLLAACKTLGLKDPKKTFKTVSLELYLKTNHDRNNITISKLLKMIVQAESLNSDYAFQCAKLSYESQIHNPLLRIWENVIASMAEATEDGKITDAMIHCINLSLKRNLTHFYEKKDLLKQIKLNIKNSAHFAYDADIKSKVVANDGRSARGAFVLYNRCGSSERNAWKQIVSADEFCLYVIGIVKNSFTQLKIKEKFSPEIKEYILNGHFLTDCLRAYHVDNRERTDDTLIKKINVLSHTPWKDKAGNSSDEVLRIYFENMGLLSSAMLSPKNAATLFVNVIEFARKMPEKLKNNLHNNPAIKTPLIIKGVHACSMMFGHETFASAINSSAPSTEWITEKLITPGKMISNSKISDVSREKIVRFVTSYTIPALETEGLEKFTLKTNGISANLTIREYRNATMAIIKEISTENYHPLKKIAEGLDYFIFKYVISDDEQHKLLESSVHFADTNWDAGLHDIHFCFMFNPGSGELEMWEIYEDNTGAYPLSQDDWIAKQPWMVYNF
jgi:hypothetical protein